MDDLISRQAMLDGIDKLIKIHFDRTVVLYKARQVAENLPSAQPERKTVFNRDIAIEAICDEVMLWFDISATQAYEIAETAVKRIEVRMEKTNRGEKE